MTLRVLALDFETSINKTCHGSTFRDVNNDIYTVIAAKTPENVVVEHRLEGFKRILPLEQLKDIDLLIGHNISFDLGYVFNDPQVQEFVKRGGRIHDTQISEYILTGQQHTTSSLAELQAKYLGEVEKPSRITALFKRGIGADKILASRTRCKRLFKLYDYYCRTDGSTPLRIFKAQYIRAKKQNMLGIVELYNDYLLGCINMTCTGIHIDVSGAERLQQEFTLKHLQHLQEAQEILTSVWRDERLPEFNINSVDHKSAVLFGGSVKVTETVDVGFYKNGKPKTKKQELYVPVQGYGLSIALTHKMKKDGLYSTDEKVLNNIKNAAIHNSNVAAPDVLKYIELQELSMKYKKAAKTYCQAFIDRNVNGVLFPNFNSTITPTGRLTSSEPNMQNCPSKGELAADIQGLLVAPTGWKAVSIDFSQLEKWVQCLVSGDSTLRGLLEAGTCLHCTTLAKMEGMDYDEVYRLAKIEQDPVWDKKRTNIKPVGFQMDYGAMPKTVSADTGMPLEEVEEIYRIDKEMFPEKHNFFDNTLPNAVKSSMTFSLACNIAKSKRKGKGGAQVWGKAEMLPIFDKDKNVHYNQQELRKIGTWQTNYGKLYHFTDTGRMGRNGLQRNFPIPKFKNYPNQGGGADIQAITTAALLKVLFTKRDKVRMINEIHDSKCFYVREDCLEPVLKWLKETIEDVPKLFKERFNIDVPFRFPVEIEYGDNFGMMQVYKFK